MEDRSEPASITDTFSQCVCEMCAVITLAARLTPAPARKGRYVKCGSTPSGGLFGAVDRSVRNQRIAGASPTSLILFLRAQFNEPIERPGLFVPVPGLGKCILRKMCGEYGD